MNRHPNYPHPLPAIPDGFDFARDSFWHRYRHKFQWQREIRAWAWYMQQRDKAALYQKPFPPAPVFQRKTTVPQPWDGRDEMPGRVPRTGKE